MSAKPDDSPQDVWVAADAAFGAHENPYADIARAILAERERCAKVAEQRFTHESVVKTRKGQPYATGSAAIYAAGCIASAIRKGGD